MSRNCEGLHEFGSSADGPMSKPGPRFSNQAAESPRVAQTKTLGAVVKECTHPIAEAFHRRE
jgi:hypothetical protein